MQDFLVLNLVKSEVFTLVLEKVVTKLKIEVVKMCEDIKQADLIFVDSSSLISHKSSIGAHNFIGVSMSPDDISAFYKSNIFFSIPENISESQMKELLNQQRILQKLDLLQLSLKKNKLFAFENLTYYLDTVFMNSSMGVAFLTEDLEILLHNPNFSSYFHNIYNEVPIIGKPIHKNSNDETISFWNKLVDSSVSSLKECVDLIGRWDDKSKHYQMQIIPITKLTNLIGYAIIIKDISQFADASADIKRYYKYLAEQNARLEEAYADLELNNEKLKIAYEKVNALSKHDYLTQAPNRKYFLEKIEYEQLRFKRTKTTFVIAYGDIDNFKLVNDNYGHETGDYILITLANLIKTTIRNIDFFCRWGGEEFVIFLAESNLVSGKMVANRIRQAIKDYEFIYNGEKISITMTFGLAIYDKDQHINKIIDLADQKLYWGKSHNKDQVVADIPDE